MKNNPIFQVLVVTNGSLRVADGNPWDLAVGQLGIFDAETNLAVTAAIPDKFYLAVGIANAAGTIGDIRKSAGEHIKKALLNTVFSKHPEAGAEQTIVADFTGLVPIVGQDYVIRLTFLSGHILTQNGFVLPSKTFVVTATTAVLADLVNAITDEINKDLEGVVVATDDGATTVTMTIKTEPLAQSVAGINPNYSFLRQLKAVASFGGRFEFETAHIAITDTPPVYEQGSGYDIQQWEYVAGGWKGKPSGGIYRNSEVLGQFFGETEIFADKTKKYWTMRLNYNYPSNSGGFLDYSNQMETVVCIEDTFANKGFMDALNALFLTVTDAQPQSEGSYETTEKVA